MRMDAGIPSQSLCCLGLGIIFVSFLFIFSVYFVQLYLQDYIGQMQNFNCVFIHLRFVKKSQKKKKSQKEFEASRMCG